MTLFKKSDHFAGVFKGQYLPIDTVGHHIEDEIPRLRFIVDHCDLHILDYGILPVFVGSEIISSLMLRSIRAYSQADLKSRPCCEPARVRVPRSLRWGMRAKLNRSVPYWEATRQRAAG